VLGGKLVGDRRAASSDSVTTTAPWRPAASAMIPLRAAAAASSLKASAHLAGPGSGSR